MPSDLGNRIDKSFLCVFVNPCTLFDLWVDPDDSGDVFHFNSQDVVRSQQEGIDLKVVWVERKADVEEEPVIFPGQEAQMIIDGFFTVVAGLSFLQIKLDQGLCFMKGGEPRQ